MGKYPFKFTDFFKNKFHIIFLNILSYYLSQILFSKILFSKALKVSIINGNKQNRLLSLSLTL